MKVADTNTTAVDKQAAEAIDTKAAEATETASETEPVVTDTAETVAEQPKKELAGKDDAPNKGESNASKGTLADKMQAKLDEQVEKYRLESQIGNKTIAKPNDEQNKGSIKTVDAGEAKEIDDAGKELDAGMKRGRRVVLDAGKKAARTGVAKEEKSAVSQAMDDIGFTADALGIADTLGAIGNSGDDILAPALGFSAGLVGLGTTTIGIYQAIGGAHQDAHKFNEKVGYSQGYSKAFAAGLYGEAAPSRAVKPGDNSKKQTFDFAYRDGARDGYNDAVRLSDEDKAASRMYIESKMADNNEDYLWGNTDVAGAYVKRGGAWNAEMLP